MICVICFYIVGFVFIFFFKIKLGRCLILPYCINETIKWLLINCRNVTINKYNNDFWINEYFRAIVYKMTNSFTEFNLSLIQFSSVFIFREIYKQKQTTEIKLITFARLNMYVSFQTRCIVNIKHMKSCSSRVMYYSCTIFFCSVIESYSWTGRCLLDKLVVCIEIYVKIIGSLFLVYFWRKTCT